VENLKGPAKEEKLILAPLADTLNSSPRMWFFVSGPIQQVSTVLPGDGTDLVPETTCLIFISNKK